MTDFGISVLGLDGDAEVRRISDGIRKYLSIHKRRGVVVAMSGGIDSSVVAALCAAAVTKDRVLGLLLPERESSADTLRLSRLAADTLRIRSVVEDITPMLDSAGCYRRRNEAIRLVYPELDERCAVKITLPGLLEGNSLRLFSIIIRTADGREIKRRLTPESYLGIVAASNFKQRIRTMLAYYYADRMNYVVAGTPNRLEYDQGFFVKQGDGTADIKPIAHLYKSQVYQLAGVLNIPLEIRTRPPTTDTYSLPQSQEEFFFSLPYEKMDLCLYGKNHHIPEREVAVAAGISIEQVKKIFQDIDQKRKTTAYLHHSSALIETVSEVSSAEYL